MRISTTAGPRRQFHDAPRQKSLIFASGRGGYGSARSRFAWRAMTLGLAVIGFSVCAQDVVPALVSASSVNGHQAGICFNKAMDPVSLNQPVNYLIEDAEGIKGVAEAVAQPDNQGVWLKVDPPLVGEFVITTGFLFDSAGNLLEPGSTVTGRVARADLTLADIGATSPTGLVFSCTQDQLAVSADGSLLNEQLDRLAFLHVPRTNDFDVSVRLNGLANVASPYAGAGLMVRQDLDPGSVQRTILATATNGANRVYILARPQRNALTGHIETGPLVQSFPLWLRLKRSGPWLTAFTSFNPAIAWEQAGSAFTIPSLGAETLVGLATISAAGGSAVTASFQDFGDTLVLPQATVSIVQAPADVTVEAHLTATFNVTAKVSGGSDALAQYQWQTETAPGSGIFTNIYFATGKSYTTPALTEADSGTSFQVAVLIAGHAAVFSRAAVLTVTADVTGPGVLLAAGTRQLHEIVLTFSEPLDPATALAAGSYRVDSLLVTNVLLDPTGTRVLLQLAGPQVPGTTNLVHIANVLDRLGHPLVPNPATIPAPASGLADGYALRELYYGVPGSSLNALRFSALFPSFPNDFRYITDLEGPNDLLWEYGTRLSGFLIPPVTGNYNFWMCSDNEGEFRLSTDTDPAHLVLLCREPQFNSYRNFLGVARRTATAPENRSQTLFPGGVPLQVGRSYYFEALSKNASFYGNLSVAWQIPGGPSPTNGSAPIPGRYLSSLVDPARVTLAITQPPMPAAYSFADANGSGERVLFETTFDVDDGQFSAALTGDPSGAWTYLPAAGAWSTDGSGLSSVPSDKTLTSPPLTVTRPGQVQLTFDHRYSFEYDGSIGWDGGQVQISVNDGAFRPVAGSAFAANGYTRIIQGIAGLFGQEGFNGDSAGYANSLDTTSVAGLGFFNGGEVVRLRFAGAWDEFSTGSVPNWVIDRVQIKEGLTGGRAVTFSVLGQGTVDYAPNQPVAYQWQRDCGSGYVDVPGADAPIFTFFPGAADLGCRYRCLVGLPGVMIPGTSATFGPILSASRQNGQLSLSWTEAARLEQAVSPLGPWSEVTGVTGTYVVPIEGPNKCYRLVVQ